MAMHPSLLTNLVLWAIITARGDRYQIAPEPPDGGPTNPVFVVGP